MATTLSDEEIDVFIEWLITRDSLGKSAIQIAINTITELKNDRSILLHELERIRFKEPTEDV